MTEPRQLLLIVALIAIMIVAGVAGARRQPAGALVLGLAGFVWLLVDTSYEGTTLWTVTATHGLTTSDLVGLADMLIAAIMLLRLRR